jgi:hypothetical protein
MSAVDLEAAVGRFEAVHTLIDSFERMSPDERPKHQPALISLLGASVDDIPALIAACHETEALLAAERERIARDIEDERLHDDTGTREDEAYNDAINLAAAIARNFPQ